MSQSFQIFIDGSLSSGEGQSGALSEEQKAVAAKFGISEEAYRSSALALQAATKRTHAQAQSLGELVESILSGLGPDYRLVAVSRNFDKGVWNVRIQGNDAVFNVVVPRELADDVLDSGSLIEVDRLKNLILFGVGRRELIVER